jgi:hypothetical protein
MNRTNGKSAATFTAAALAILAVVALLARTATVIARAGLEFVSGLSGLCGNERISELLSPNQKLKLIIFERDCGAISTDLSTQASLVPANFELSQGLVGNIYSSDTNHGAAPAGAGGGPELRARWISERELELAHHVRARVFFAAC